MRKLLLLLIPFLLFADENYTGVGDTASISSVLVDGTKQYTTVFNMRGEDVWIAMLVDDTAESGFANDSTYYEWGIQLGSPCLDSGETEDTVWEDHIVIDTMVVDSFGVSNNATMGTDGAITRYISGIDTSSVSGYATQMRKPDITDVYAPLIRGWVNSLGDPSKDGNGLDIRFQFIQKAYVPTRRR